MGDDSLSVFLGVLLSDDQGSPAVEVSARDEAVLSEDYKGARALDLLLDGLDAFLERGRAGDDLGDELGRVGLAGAQLREVLVLGKHLFLQLGYVAYLAYCDDCEASQMGIDDYGLRVSITDHPDAEVTGVFVQVILEFYPEVGILQRVDIPCEDTVTVVDRHAAPACSQMRMIVYSVEEVVSALLCGDDSEYSSHKSRCCVNSAANILPFSELFTRKLYPFSS